MFISKTTSVCMFFFCLSELLSQCVIYILIQSVNQELEEGRLQLTIEQEKVINLEKKCKQLEVRGKLGT